MSEYQIGKDVQALESKVAEIEEALKIISTRVAPCSESEIELELVKELTTTDSTSVNFEAAEAGRCTWDAHSVSFFSNGRVVFTCNVDCNEPSFFTCTFTTKVYAVLDGRGGPRIEVFNFSVPKGGVTRDASISRETNSGAIRDSFSRIWGAAMGRTCTCINC